MKKYLGIFFAVVMMFLSIAVPSAVLADVESGQPAGGSSGGTVLKLSVPIGGVGQLTFQEGGGAYTQLAEYIVALYRYGIVLAVALAMMMVMIGGFIWVTAAGASDRIGKAKEFITAALTGLVLALFSYMILFIVNPQLTQLQPIRVATVPIVPVPTAEALPVYGCCLFLNTATSRVAQCVDTTKEGCQSSDGLRTANYYENQPCSNFPCGTSTNYVCVEGRACGARGICQGGQCVTCAGKGETCSYTAVGPGGAVTTRTPCCAALSCSAIDGVTVRCQ